MEVYLAFLAVIGLIVFLICGTTMADIFSYNHRKFYYFVQQNV